MDARAGLNRFSDGGYMEYLDERGRAASMDGLREKADKKHGDYAEMKISVRLEGWMC